MSNVQTAPASTVTLSLSDLESQVRRCIKIW
jgi:hypothetical protein